MINEVVIWGIAVTIKVLVTAGVDVIDEITRVALHQLASRGEAEDGAGVAYGGVSCCRREGGGLRR